MKIENYDEIQDEVVRQLIITPNTLVDMVGFDVSVWAISSIYYSNNLTKAYTMHIEAIAPTWGTGNITIISTPQKLSIIYGKRSARWTELGAGKYVNYESLEEDIRSILNIVQLTLQQII